MHGGDKHLFFRTGLAYYTGVGPSPLWRLPSDSAGQSSELEMRSHVVVGKRLCGLKMLLNIYPPPPPSAAQSRDEQTRAGNVLVVSQMHGLFHVHLCPYAVDYINMELERASVVSIHSEADDGR